MKTYNITPVAKPRQTRSDIWKKRPCVMKYRAFADEVRAAGIEIPESGAHIIFVIPMPKSWSKHKKTMMDGRPHQQVPDVDNLAKAVLDSIFKNDSHIWDICLSKVWGNKGAIIINAPERERCLTSNPTLQGKARPEQTGMVVGSASSNSGGLSEALKSQ